MKVEKQITINLGNFESLKIGVTEVPNWEEADEQIKYELKRLGITVSEKIKRCLSWNQDLDRM